MPKSSYDVVIVGMDLPALIFGAIAAKRGYRVLVIGHGAKENIYEVEGHHFVRRPEILYGFSDSNPIKEVFRELALNPEMRNLPKPLSPSCHIVLPEARVEVTHLKGVLEEEIAREFGHKVNIWREFISGLPEGEKGLEKCLKDFPILPPHGIREFFIYRRYRKFVAQLLAPELKDALYPLDGDSRIRHVLAAPVKAMSMISEPWRFPLPFTRLANQVLRGFSLVEWGSDAIKSLLVKRIQSNSGDVRPKDWVDSIIVKRGKIREIELRTHEESIGVEVLVAGTDLCSILDLIPPNSAKKRYRAKVEKRIPSEYLVTVNIAARSSLIPEGMARYAFVINRPEKPLVGDNYIIIQVDPAMPPEEQKNPEWSVLAVSGFMPSELFDGTVSSVEGFAEKVVNQLKQFMPFLDLHAQYLSVSSIMSDPRSGRKIVDPAGLVKIYKDVMPRSLDLALWPVRTAYKNLLYLGDSISGTLGFEGAFFFAFQAVSILKKLVEKKNVL